MEALRSCRCCLRRAPDKDLKTPYTHLGNTEIYLDMLKECFNIQLNEDGEECGICSACVGRLRDASAFKLQVQRSQAELQARLERALQAIVADEKPVVKLEVGDSGTSDDTLCEEPPVVISVKLELEEDNGTSQDLCFTLNEEPAVKSEASGDAASDDCATLSRAGAGRVDWEPARRLAGARSGELLGEATCPATSRRGPRLATRMKDTPDDTAGLHADEQDTGEGAGAPHTEHFSSKRVLVLHICGICDKQFTRKSDLTSHIRTHTKKRPYTCDVCSKTFKDSSNLRKHQRIHTGDKRYTCNICDKQFSQKGNLNTHIRIHKGQKSYACDVCSKTFTQMSHLNMHQRIHTGDKRLTCSLCDKQFSQKSSLINHIRLHTKEKPYCDICSKMFSSSSTLRRHQRIHSGDKRYACNICDKHFLQKSNLNSHMSMHTGQKSYTCDVCSKSFTQKSHLNMHQRVHTGDKPYACETCKKQFSQKGNLITHIRMHTRQ